MLACFVPRVDMRFTGLRVSRDRYTYQVTVSDLQGLVDAIANLTRGSLPGTISQLTMQNVSKRLNTNSNNNTYGIL